MNWKKSMNDSMGGLTRWDLIGDKIVKLYRNFKNK